LPVHSPPGLWRYFSSQLRLQVLFTLVPLAMILLLRDLICLTLYQFGVVLRNTSELDPLVLLGSSTLVFVFAPVILRHVLRTQPLPDSPLRKRLEEICRRCRLRYRDILLWRTDNNMGNAAVMGILPWVRYILLSDLLLETMSDEQVEAVFAHEVGHIVHRHMAWYVVLVVILMVGTSAPADALKQLLIAHGLPRWAGPRIDLVMEAVAIAIFFGIFGVLSRRFERQADVFAARTIQEFSENAGSIGVTSPIVPATAPVPAVAGSPQSYVGEYGAAVFASALHRVAIVNNIPVRARNFSHGSIAARMKYLYDLSTDPARTGRFDRAMMAIYATLVIALVLSIAAAAIVF